MENEEKDCCSPKMRNTPRSQEEVKDLKNRLSRIVGQLNGISKMIEENRYCGDVLTQIAAAESALQSVGYIVLSTHMKTCVAEDIKEGKEGVIDETVSLIKKLK
jgi:DNA-binding FrmR family transcriptional regulator